MVGLVEVLEGEECCENDDLEALAVMDVKSTPVMLDGRTRRRTQSTHLFRL